MNAIFCPLVKDEQRNIVTADMHVGSIFEALIFVQLGISTLELVNMQWAPASTLKKNEEQRSGPQAECCEWSTSAGQQEK